MSVLRHAMGHAVLGWVKPELDATLRQVREDLELFAGDPAEHEAIVRCAGHLHQVQGTLRMLELYAPGLVAEELEQLAAALQAGTVADRDEACAALLRGTLLLPDYLERLQSGHRDIPIVLLPLLNDIRMVRGAEPLGEEVLFASDGGGQTPSEAELHHARSSLGGRNRALLDTVGSVVKDDLLRVKEALDLHLRTHGDPAALQPQVAALTHVADTLGMMELSAARNVVLEQRDRLREIAEGRQQAEEGALLDVAGALLYVDASLDDQVAHLGLPADAADTEPSVAETLHVVEALAKEAIVNFATARDGFIAFIETGWDHAQLSQVPTLLGEVAGAMRMLELSNAAAYLEGVQRYVAVELLGKQRVPGGHQLDTLADAIASLEYYLEALQQGRGNGEDILEIARARLEELRYWPLPEATDAAEPALRREGDADADADAGTGIETETDIDTGAEVSADVPLETDWTLAAVEPAVAEPAAWLTEGSDAVAHDVRAEDSDDPGQYGVDREGDAARSEEATLPSSTAGFHSVDDGIDDEIREVFLEELAEETEHLGNLLPRWREVPDDLERVRPIRRIFHTLKGSGRLVGATALGEFAWSVERMLNGVLEARRPVSPAVLALVERAWQVLPSVRAQLEGEAVQPPADLPGLAGTADRIAAGEDAFYAPVSATTGQAAWPSQSQALSVAQGAGGVEDGAGVPAFEGDGTPAELDSVLLEILQTEVDTHVRTVEAWLSDAGVGTSTEYEAQLRAWHTLNGAFAMADVPEITAVTAAAEGYVRRLQLASATPSPEGVTALAEAAHVVRRCMATLAGAAPRMPSLAALAQRLAALRDTEAPLPPPDADEAPTAAGSGLDRELVGIFVEEGSDLLDHADSLLDRLRRQADDRDTLTGLQRDLHTLKGGARMAGIDAIGDLGHAIESLLEAVAGGRTGLGPDDLQMLAGGFDALHDLLGEVQQGRATHRPLALIEAFEARTRHRPVPVQSVPATVAASHAVPAPLSAPLPVEDSGDAGMLALPQEQVRVRADLLDRVVNRAGEVAIYRARLEQLLGAFRGAMAELDRTNTRLRDQLRRLDLETEAQIVARYQREQDPGDQGFDPLELDRFSALQQLSRGLAESAADLGGLQSALDDMMRQHELLLQQQARVGTELQEGLMRTRMVPFDGLVPRLRRVLRQAATDTGKQVQLQLEGTHGELDRNVLDRMVAPLEHMLRNSVAHGLELPQDRRAANKPEEGTVRIALRREGSEIVLEVSDDGAGLDRVAIRRRAEAQGLVQPDAVLSETDLDALIFESGFSTSHQVSQLAGRGVGMDVVRNEVRQLGGTVDVVSMPGQGAVFTLRLPQTLAVTRAVFVQIGEMVYAVPVASVGGIGHLARARFDSEDRSYRYGGEHFTLHDLGTLVGQPRARAEGQPQVPLLLVRSGDLRAAVAVDQVLGNREIVVKPVGPQIASIPGIYGATLTGEGRVVVILDMAPLVRRHLLLPQVATEVPVPAQRQVPLVLVVDDSLTMRKVTGRVLERHNFEVQTARDGVEALEKMEERVPDLMLLDVEMPRMDGYELASAMKAVPRLSGVPIVMITSRTGEKHRQRALDIGVDRYMGKPYQELDLMRNVYDLLGKARARH